MTLSEQSNSGDDWPEMPEMPKIRVFVTVDYYGDGVCVAEAISHHRACSHVVESFSGGPTGALRALADRIDAEEDHYSRIPD
jgi:hypothetical protein